MITEKGDEHSLPNPGTQKETSSRLPPVPEVSETDSQTSNIGSQPVEIESNKFEGGMDGVHTPMQDEESANESQETDIDSDVPGFNWEQLESRFTAAIQQLDTEESQILDQFDHLMEMFFIWAQTGSALETDRSVKRLKTRERYVQLSETSLEKKKEHYVQVVTAFKNALDLLRG